VAATTPEKVPVVNFMVLRSPQRAAEAGLHRNWVRDDFFDTTMIITHVPPPDADSLVNRSPVVRLVYQQVFCTDGATLDTLIDQLLHLLPAAQPRCHDLTDTGGDGEGGGDGEVGGGALPLIIEDLEQHPYLVVDGTYHLIQDTLDAYLSVPLIPHLIRAGNILRSLQEPLDVPALLTELADVFDRRLVDVIFTDSGHSGDYKALKRTLFDALYLLFILRRRTTRKIGRFVYSPPLAPITFLKLYPLLHPTNPPSKQSAGAPANLGPRSVSPLYG
jgi:hypothetical protein